MTQRASVSWTTAALLWVSAAALAQMHAGPEFRVNTYTTGHQLSSASAAWDGGFIVVWQSRGADGSDFTAVGRLFAPDGSPRGAEFQANTFTTGPQQFVDVAADARGNFAMVWDSAGRDGSASGVAGRLYDAAGVPRTPEFVINTFTTGAQGYPSVAMSPAGNFVVVWRSDLQDGSQTGVFGQRFDALGSPVGSEFQVNSNITGRQSPCYHGAVAMDAAGSFVVVWDDTYLASPGPAAVKGQRFAPDGSRLGAEFRVNIPPDPFLQALPAVAATPAGEFVVAWDNDGEVYARRYDAMGVPAGAGFQVSTTPLAGLRPRPNPAFDGVGNMAVTWQGPLIPIGAGAFVRRFDTSGNPRGGEVLLNASSFANYPAIASDSAGNLLTTFSRGISGAAEELFGRRFGGLTPAALAVDTAGNGVLEPGETVGVRPSWRNISTAAQAFGGGLSAMTGPPGATYAITDATASYGTVPDATTQACVDCYGVSVSNPPSRPAVHWDASAIELITPDALGQTERWRLHIGDSFTDLSRTNPFYRFVETVLHADVTGGCSPDSYCPTAPTSREQMAVFVLVAKERAGYSPPACVPPNLFADVPETSVYCRWIEELANRGVVAGCGSGNYCPTAEVAREEMAVFVLRTLDPALNPPACVPPNIYDDVPEASPFCRWIEELTNRNVVTGCGGGDYCPGAPVSREQMSVFIAATFRLSLYGP